MDKKEYCVPELEFVSFRLQDVILSSPENFNSYLESGSDDWGNPIIDSEDDPFG